MRASLPEDAPESLVLLAFQCLEYESLDRPASDVVSGNARRMLSVYKNDESAILLLDWLDDLLQNGNLGDSSSLPTVPPVPAFEEDEPPSIPPISPLDNTETLQIDSSSSLSPASVSMHCLMMLSRELRLLNF